MKLDHILIILGAIVLPIFLLAGLFIWALINRQFQNQDRARYLPLDKEHNPSNKQE